MARGGRGKGQEILKLRRDEAETFKLNCLYDRVCVGLQINETQLKDMVADRQIDFEKWRR